MPGKNTRVVGWLSLTEYPLVACRDSGVVDRMYVSTDDPLISRIAGNYGVETIWRPEHLCEDASLLEDAIHHGFLTVYDRHPDLELVVITQCNAPYVTKDGVARAVKMLRENPALDSVITVVRMDGYSPERARTTDSDGCMIPYVPFEAFNKGVTCDRSSQRAVYYYDSALTVVRATCLHDMSANLPPFRWMGSRIGHIEQEASPGDIDYEWQLPMVEQWLKRAHGMMSDLPSQGNGNYE